MKNSRVVIIATAIVCLAFFTTCLAAEKTSSVLAPLSNERLVIVTGEKAMTALGLKDGIIKGDVGLIAPDQDAAARGAFVGKCAVVKAGLGSSVCEVITLKKEVEGGNLIFFDRVAYKDQNVYQVAMAMLSEIVEPYEPYKQLKVMIYGIFDDHHAVTGLSETLKKEMTSIFSQKKRIQMVGNGEFKDLVFYPGASPDVLYFVKTKMQKADIDVLLFGEYSSDGQNITLTLTRVAAASGTYGSWQFSLPAGPYEDSLAKVVMPPQPATQVENYPCSIFVKGSTAKVQKANEKAEVVKHEAEGNAFTELSLKRSDFNILSPTDIKVKIDDAMVLEGQGPSASLAVPISAGNHRVVVSFRRGYYFDESLVYTSQREVRKEINLELHRIKNLILDVQLSPLFGPDTIALKVSERIGNQQQVLRSIRRLEWDSTIETFKD